MASEVQLTVGRFVLTDAGDGNFRLETDGDSVEVTVLVMEAWLEKLFEAEF